MAAVPLLRHPVTHRASAAWEAAVAAMIAMAMAATKISRGVTWQNSHYKWIQKRSDSSFIV